MAVVAHVQKGGRLSRRRRWLVDRHFGGRLEDLGLWAGLATRRLVWLYHTGEVESVIKDLLEGCVVVLFGSYWLRRRYLGRHIWLGRRQVFLRVDGLGLGLSLRLLHRYGNIHLFELAQHLVVLGRHESQLFLYPGTFASLLTQLLAKEPLLLRVCLVPVRLRWGVVLLVGL